jgi:hypothetical protein
MIQSEDLLIYWARNSEIALRAGNAMESSKTSRGKHGDQTSDFSKIRCGVGLQNPNGSKSQTGQGISP